MPMAPQLSPEQALASQSAASGPNAANFLIAAADMHNSGQLADPQRSAPVPRGKALVSTSYKGQRKVGHMKVLK